MDVHDQGYHGEYNKYLHRKVNNVKITEEERKTETNWDAYEKRKTNNQEGSSHHNIDLEHVKYLSSQEEISFKVQGFKIRKAFIFTQLYHIEMKD